MMCVMEPVRLLQNLQQSSLNPPEPFKAFSMQSVVSVSAIEEDKKLAHERDAAASGLPQGVSAFGWCHKGLSCYVLDAA